MKRVDLSEVPGQLLDLVNLAANGEDVVIIENDRPLVKLIRAVTARKQRKFGSAAGLITITYDFDAPLEDFADCPK